MQCNDPGSDSHSIRSPDSRLQTPPRLCSLPTVMCALCVCVLQVLGADDVAVDDGQRTHGPMEPRRACMGAVRAFSNQLPT